MFMVSRKNFSLVAEVLVFGAVFFSTNLLNAKNLLDAALRNGDFTNTVSVFMDEFVVSDDTGHPVANDEFIQGIAAKDNVTYQYDSGYKFGATLLSPRILVVNFRYQYPLKEIAGRVASLISEHFIKVLNATILEETVSQSIHAYRMKIIDDEMGFAYWFVGKRDNVLSLVMVNGFDENQVSKTFEYVLPLA